MAAEDFLLLWAVVVVVLAVSCSFSLVEAEAEAEGLLLLLGEEALVREMDSRRRKLFMRAAPPAGD